MTNPPPPGPGDSFPSDPLQPYQPAQPYEQPQAQPYQPSTHTTYQTPQPYQPPQSFVPETPYGQPAAYDPNAPYGYGMPYGQPQYPIAPQNDGLAIASMVISCVAVPLAVCTWGVGAVLGVLGAILGHVARKRVRETGAGGAGMALTGIIVGWCVVGLGLVIGGALLVSFVLLQNNAPNY